MFYANFEKSIFASMHQTTKCSKESLDCLKGVVLRKTQVGCGQALS